MESSFFERVKSEFKTFSPRKALIALVVCGLVVGAGVLSYRVVGSYARFASINNAMNQRHADKAELLERIDKMEKEIRELRPVYIEEKGEAGAKEVDDMLAELERMRRRVKGTR